MLTVAVILTLITYCSAQHAEELNDDYNDIHDLMKHLVKVFENPSLTSHSQLRDSAVIYLNKLISLEAAVKAGTPQAERLVHEIYKEETYKELTTAPFSMLVGHYGWNNLECAELESVVFKANDIWRYFLTEIIHEKEPSIPTQHRVFLW